MAYSSDDPLIHRNISCFILIVFSAKYNRVFWFAFLIALLVEIGEKLEFETQVRNADLSSCSIL
jgi:hypothetical protein